VLWCRANRHEPVIEQQRSLNLKLRGHYGYYGITGNFRVETITRKRGEPIAVSAIA